MEIGIDKCGIPNELEIKKTEVKDGYKYPEILETWKKRPGNEGEYREGIYKKNEKYSELKKEWSQYFHNF